MTLDQAIKLQEEQARCELEMCYRLTVEEIVEYLHWAQSQSSGMPISSANTERLASEVQRRIGRRAG